MGEPFQTLSMKDLIEIIRSLAGGMSDERLVEMLGEITKKILEENDPDCFDEEKKKAYEAKVRADKAYAKTYPKWEDMSDGDWQPIEEQTFRRLREGRTQTSYSVALKERPLLTLLINICQVYHHSNFDRMLEEVLSELNRLGYDTQEQEERLRSDKRYTYKEFFADLVHSAVATRRKSAVAPSKKPVKAAASPANRKPDPIPEDPRFDPRLLADIEVKKNRKTIRYYWLADEGSPLAQLLWEWEQERLFLLYGEEDSGVAGAGKTTAMRHLLQEKEFRNAAYVPLWEVYKPFGMRRMTHEKGVPRVLEWLEQQGRPVGPDERKLLLLDGLDEIAAGEGIRSFCDDLTVLSEDDRFTLVLSSVILPEKLPNWSELCNINSLLSQFVKCCIQPLTPMQRQACLGDRVTDYPQALTTPHQVSLYRDVSFAAAEQKNLFFRWVAEGEHSGHGASLFYRSLATQICSWFRADPVNDARNERDSFMLMFALPAVAFRMAVNEIYDEHYAPEARPMDAGTVDRLLRLAFPVYARSLHCCSCYQKSEAALAALADSMRNVGEEGLLSEKTGAVLCRSFHPVTMEYVYHFPNKSMRDGLAALHLANLFCFARENLLPTGPEFDEFYTCPVRFLPYTLLESAVVLANERWQMPGAMQCILESGPFCAYRKPNPFCDYITCSLGAAFCTARSLESEERWRNEAEMAYHKFLSAEPRMAENCAMDHVHNLCVESRKFREKRIYHAAAEKARAAAQFAQKMDLLNADGYQALAMIYLTQVQDGLNLYRAWEDYSIPISQAEIDRASKIFEELQRLAQLPEIKALESEESLALPGENDPFMYHVSWLEKVRWQLAHPTELVPLESEVFGTLPAESVPLVPDCLCLLEKTKLRLDAYKQAEYFGSREVEFLLTASFVAKAHSVWAALGPAASGAALNLLAGFFEKDQECLENDPELPFFAANSRFHLSIDPKQLAYSEKDCRAARLYLRIIHLRRGIQPYSCRNLAQALLSRRFRLNEMKKPISADGVEKRFSMTEQDFLDEITYRASTRLRPTYAIPRIRWLHEQIDSLSNRPGHEAEIASYREEAAALFRREWKQGNCGEKLDSGSEAEADLLSVMLAGLYHESYLPGTNPVSWMAKIKDYHFRCENTRKLYTIGDSFR